MSEVIDVFSSDEDDIKLNKFQSNFSNSIAMEPAAKKRKLNNTTPSDVIILTDEEDAHLNKFLDVPDDVKLPIFPVKKILNEHVEYINTCDANDDVKEIVDDPVLELDDSDVEMINDDIPEEVVAQVKEVEKTEPTDVTETTETAETNGKEASSDTDSVGEGSLSSKENISVSDSSKSSTISKEIAFSEQVEEFIETCKKSVKLNETQVKIEEKIPVLRKAYSKASAYIESDEFKNMISGKLKSIQETPSLAVRVFMSVFRDLKLNSDKEYSTDRYTEKLYMFLKKVSRRIKRLEETEVNFEEEQNSSYMKLQRYRQRAVDIGVKIKKLEQGDTNFGQLSYGRLDFARSQYPEINRALNKKFHDRRKIPFPTYLEVSNCIKKCVSVENLKISEADLKIEVDTCFEALGNLIQRKRQQDLASAHFEYLVEVGDDPAKNDPELERKLNEHKRDAQENYKNIFEKYTQLQNKGVNPDLSEDSDDSKMGNSEDETPDDDN